MSDRAATRPGGRLEGWRAAAVWLVIVGLLGVALACVLLIPEQEAMPTWDGVIGAAVVAVHPTLSGLWLRGPGLGAVR